MGPVNGHESAKHGELERRSATKEHGEFSSRTSQLLFRAWSPTVPLGEAVIWKSHRCDTESFLSGLVLSGGSGLSGACLSTLRARPHLRAGSRLLLFTGIRSVLLSAWILRTSVSVRILNGSDLGGFYLPDEMEGSNLFEEFVVVNGLRDVAFAALVEGLDAVL